VKQKSLPSCIVLVYLIPISDARYHEHKMKLKYDMIGHIHLLQLGSHPMAAVQYTFTQKHYTERQETDSTQNNTKKLERMPCPIFVSYTLAFALQLRRKHGKPSVRVVEECQLAGRRYVKI